jgi:hypothetical protein
MTRSCSSLGLPALVITVATVAVVALPLVASHAFAAEPRCGQPVTTGDVPKASDALSVLRTAVGTVPCQKCICDVDRTGTITTGDALRVLRKAVLLPVTIRCVDCLASATIGPDGGTVTSHDGRLELDIPAGALDAPTEITIDGAAPSSLPDAFDDAFVDEVYQLGPGGAVFDPPIHVKYEPRAETVTATDSSVTFDYPLLVTEAGGSPESLVDLHARYELETGDAEITGTLAHFSPLAVLSETNKGVTLTIQDFPTEHDVDSPPFDAKMVISTETNFLELEKPVDIKYEDDPQCDFTALPVANDPWTSVGNTWVAPIQGECNDGGDVCRVEFQALLHQEYAGFPAEVWFWIVGKIKCTGSKLKLPRTEIEEPHAFRAPFASIDGTDELRGAAIADQIIGIGTADGSTAFNLDTGEVEFDMTNEVNFGHYGGFPLRSCNPDCKEAWIQYGPSRLNIWNWDPDAQSFGVPATTNITADDAYPVAPSPEDGFAASAYIAHSGLGYVARIGLDNGQFKLLGNVYNGQFGNGQNPGSIFPFPNGAMVYVGFGNAVNVPGKLFFHAGTNPATLATPIGDVGLYPRRVRCAQCTGATSWTCVSSASFGKQMFVSQINPVTGAGSVTDSKSTGTGPYGVAIRAKDGADGCWAVVSDLGEAGYEMCDIGNDGKASCEHVVLPPSCPDARFVANLLDGRFLISCQNHQELVPIANPDLP